MRTLWQDIRYAVRTLCRSPGFTAIVAGILAICMGGSMMIFTIVNELYLRPFPVPGQERLVDLDERAPQWNLPSTLVAYPDFHEWRRQNQTFDCMTVCVRRGWNLAKADLLVPLAVDPAARKQQEAAELRQSGFEVA